MLGRKFSSAFLVMPYFYVILVGVVLTLPSIESIQPCHSMKINSGKHCSYRVRCNGTIRNVIFPDDCRGSPNSPINIELFLENSDDRLNDDFHKDDVDFLDSVTYYKVSTQQHYTNLDILRYMNKLKHLDLSYNSIEQINNSPFAISYFLETLDISHNKLSVIDELFQFESYPNKLKLLSLAHNEIRDLAGSSFEELSSLKELDLSYNHIKDLTEEPFMNLTSLEILRLNHNEIKDLNGAVNSLLSLKQLYLKDNQIENINAASLKIIYDLETFDISGNQLENLGLIMFSRHWEHFDDVCKINLSSNRLTVIPNASLDNIPTRHKRQPRGYSVEVLTELDLSNNVIREINYNAFHSIAKLTTLDVSHNQITVFKVNISDLVYLKYLNLSNNYLTLLNLESFSSLEHLQNLDLSHNKLEIIPKYFKNIFFLKYLNMTHNFISNVDALRIKMFHPDGGVLDLSNNGLKKLNIPSGQGLRLTNLILHSNNITNASYINVNHHQSELKFLDISRNQIKGLDTNDLRLPASLVTLDLSYNYIKIVKPGAFCHIVHLKTLRLSHNRIETLDYGIFQGLMSLENLDLSYNEIKFIDSKVFIDLKFLKVLSLRYNEMYYMDYNVWLGHKFEVIVYIEGNNFTCQWLGTALNDFNNGVSRMKLKVLGLNLDHKTLEDIPCISDEVGHLTDIKSLYDEKLLVTNQKILEAVKEQTSYLRTFITNLSLDPKSDVSTRLIRIVDHK